MLAKNTQDAASEKMCHNEVASNSRNSLVVNQTQVPEFTEPEARKLWWGQWSFNKGPSDVKALLDENTQIKNSFFGLE